MHCILRTVLALSPCALAPAQAFEMFSMTVPNTVIDMDAVGPAGPTTLAAIAAAGNNGPAPLRAINLTPSTAANGIYDTNANLGRALARGAAPGSLVLVDPGSAFNAFDAEIVLSMPCTEIGIAIGDWINTMELEFVFQRAIVATLTTSPYALPDAKFFRVTTAFDTVRIRASFAVGNWVIPQLHVQTHYIWQAIGAGCMGTNGIPTLSLGAPARVGSSYALGVNHMPSTPGLWAMALGFSIEFFTGIGPLPIELGFIGAPGCQLLVDAPAREFAFHGGNTAQFTLAIPNNPSFVGIEFANQAWVLDPFANALGVTFSNGCMARIQP